MPNQSGLPDVAFAWIDGASSGNPGPAGVGVVIKKDGKTIASFKEFLGETTNNVAEYKSLILAIRKSLELGIKRLLVYTDSELLYRQLTGRYRVRNPRIKEPYEEVKLLLGGLEDFKIRHIPREQNKEADKLARDARRKR
jgi:ribonuclease HI